MVRTAVGVTGRDGVCGFSSGSLLTFRRVGVATHGRARQFAQLVIFAIGNSFFYTVYTLIVYYWSSVGTCLWGTRDGPIGSWWPLRALAACHCRRPSCCTVLSRCCVPPLQAYFSTVRQVQRRPVLFFGICVGSYIFMQTLVCVLFIKLPLETVLSVHSFSVAILGFTISVGFVYFR